MRPRIFISAFDPYEHWPENSSWLTLVEFTKTLRRDAELVTRRYPVDFVEVQQRLEDDLAEGFDFALHLGQAPGTARIQLEAVGLNLGADSAAPSESCRTLVPGAPVAYQSQLPLGEWAELLRREAIPAAVSFHAGTYLCNATLYLSHYVAEKRGLPTQATFVHLPLDVSQTADASREMASLPVALGAQAIHLIVEQMIKLSRLRDSTLA